MTFTFVHVIFKRVCGEKNRAEERENERERKRERERERE